MTDSQLHQMASGSSGPRPKPQSYSPISDTVVMADLLTAQRYWPYLPHVDFEVMEKHHPGAKELITDLRRVCTTSGSCSATGRGLYESGQAQRIVARVSAEVGDKDLASLAAASSRICSCRQ